MRWESYGYLIANIPSCNNNEERDHISYYIIYRPNNKCEQVAEVNN